MIIELHGAGLANRGAELMLRTALSELRARIPNLQGAVFPTDAFVDERLALGLRQVMPSPGRFHPLLSTVGRAEGLIAAVGGDKYARLLSWYGLVNLAMINGLVDLSGFRFGDSWGPRPAEQFRDLARAYRRRRVPVILLPQAFGPFTNPRIRAAFRGIVEAADLVYARDRASLSFARDATGAVAEKLRLAPDITMFDGFSRDSALGRGDSSTPPYCSLIPNARVVDTAGGAWLSKYDRCLSAAARAVLNAGLGLKIVLHTNERADRELGERVADAVSNNVVEVLASKDPYDLKRAIGGSHLVVGSRYHGLASALSQGVPAIALGWSHKYAGLFGDFAMERWVFDESAAPEDIAAAVNDVIDMTCNVAIRGQLKARLDALSASNGRMWAQVVDSLRSEA